MTDDEQYLEEFSNPPTPTSDPTKTITSTTTTTPRIQPYSNTGTSTSMSAPVTDLQQQGIDKIKADIEAKYGMSYEDYINSKQPPRDPYEESVRALRNSGTGDMSYEEEQLANFYQSPEGMKQMEAYWAANPEFFFPNGERKYLYQEDLEAYNLNVERGTEGFEPLSDQQREEAISRGLDPDAIYDITADRAQFEDPNAPAYTGGPQVPTSPTGPTTGTPTGPSIGDAYNQAQNDALNQDSITNPTLPEGATFQFTPQQVLAGENITPDGKLLDSGTVVSEEGLAIAAAEWASLGMPNVALINGALPELQAIQGQISAGAIIEDIPADLSQRYLDAIAVERQMLQDFQVFEGSTVKEQLAMLQDDWTGADGSNKVPFYAKGAVTAAKQQMAARGMSGSSMAAAAITQAGLESMIPVAMADAQFFQTLSMRSFDAQTAIGMAKLAHIANLDMADLNFRQQKAVDTANKFFQMDMSNIDNARTVAATNIANQVQSIFSDQAAANVANNLGFTTEAESRRFYDQMSLQAQEATSRMLLDARKFNASVQNARTEFNASMSFEIERDNINYLRAVNTANTAGINQQNMINTQNLLGISNTAIANALTLQRDNLHRIFEASENAADRAANYAIAELTAAAAMERLQAGFNNENAQNLGGFLSDVGSSLINGIFGGSGSSGGGSSGGSSYEVPDYLSDGTGGGYS